MVAVADMRAFDVFVLAALLSFFAALASGQSSPSSDKPAVFPIKYVSDNSVYLDAGRKADLAEGMKLSVVAPPPDGGAGDGVRFRGYPHIAELNVISVADSSAVCDVISSSSELQVGQLAFLAPQ